MEFFHVMRLAIGAATRAVLAELRGVGSSADTSTDTSESPQSVEVVQPHGFAARPAITATLEALVFRDGDEVTVVHLVDKGSAPLSPALAEGETRLWNAGGATVRLLDDGSVVLNGGSLDVARKTDPVAVSAAMTTWMGAVGTALNGLGAPVTSLVGTTIGTINGGSSTVKA